MAFAARPAACSAECWDPTLAEMETPTRPIEWIAPQNPRRPLAVIPARISGRRPEGAYAAGEAAPGSITIAFGGSIPASRKASQARFVTSDSNLNSYLRSLT